MQENRTPALNLVNPETRNQQQNPQIPGNPQSHANLDQQRGWGTQHSPHPLSRTTGDQRGVTQAGGGLTAHPDPLTVTRRSPCPTQVPGIHSTHTHAHRAASDTFGSLVDGARRSVATQHTPRYAGHEFTLRWGMAAPPVPCCALIRGFQVSMSSKVPAPSLWGVTGHLTW